MKTLLPLFSLFTMLILGCASTETVKESEGQGLTREYQYSYEEVFQATLDAAVDQ